MQLIAYELGHERHDLQPGRQRRSWMDATPHSYANRCLPLLIANGHGWEIRCRSTFEAVWDGGDGKDAISIQVIESGVGDVGLSHFGAGILTFHVNFLFRTEPGVSLVLTGPPNQPKHGIAPLTGVIETDWSYMTATMNWRFTAPHCPVTFTIGEPFCFLYPVQRTLVEQIEPVYRPLTSEPELFTRYEAWTRSRDAFSRQLAVDGSPEQRAGWQRHYYKGDQSAVDHRTRLAVRPFRDQG